MKDKIFKKMIQYGWNLGDNAEEDFEEVYNIHKDFLEEVYDFKTENEDFTMQDISKSRFEDMVDFMSDFLRALDEVNEVKEEETLEKKLEDAIDYFVEYTPIEELKEHIDWYNAEDICDLKEIMYESYLDSYEGKELEDRIEALYKMEE